MDNSTDTAATILYESLHVLATLREAQEIAGYLVMAAARREFFAEDPKLAIEPDWFDSCDLRSLWCAEHDSGWAGPQLPDGVGIWRIGLTFRATGSPARIDVIMDDDAGQAVEECIRRARASETIVNRSPSEGIYYFSHIHGQAMEEATSL